MMTDAEFRRVFRSPAAPCSLGYISERVDETITDEKPVGVSGAAVRSELARFWLLHDRPNGILAGLVWTWRLIRDVWMKR